VDPYSINRVLLKFTSDKYLESILSGKLYMQTVEYFRNYENEDYILRGDPDEGLHSAWNSEEVIIKINDIELSGLVGKVEYRQDFTDKTNIYCMTAISDGLILDSGNNFFLSDNFNKFGNKVVFIGGSNITEFYRRISTAIKKQTGVLSVYPNNEWGRNIQYLDRSKSQNKIGVFRKYDEYAWQHEWRLAINQEHTDGPFVLDIGSIEDICKVYDTEEVIGFKMQLQSTQKAS
jgi:hypothetical protein